MRWSLVLDWETVSRHSMSPRRSVCATLSRISTDRTVPQTIHPCSREPVPSISLRFTESRNSDMISVSIPNPIWRLISCGALGVLLLLLGGLSSSTRCGTKDEGCQSAFASLGWHQIPNTKLSGVCADDSPVRGNTGCAAIASAWNGAIADTKRNRLLIWGGGHSDYLGNELYSLDLSSMQMGRLNEAAEPATTGCQEEIGAPPAPNSRHTYGGLSYVAHRDQMFVFGGALAPSGCASHAIWALNLEGLRWERKDPVKGSTFQRMSDIPNSDYDPVTKKVYFSNTYSGEFGAYDAETNTVAVLRARHSDGFPNGISSVVDPTRRLFLSVGNGFAGGYRLTDGAPFDWSMRMHGCGPVRDALYPGMAYDPDLKRVVLWAGGGTVYLLDPDTKSCAAVTYPGGPGTQQPNGTHGRFRYFPSLGLFALLNDWKEDAWTLCLGRGSVASIEARANAERERKKYEVEFKAHGGEAIKGPRGEAEGERAAQAFLDFRKRCAAPGVLVCEGFDEPGRFVPAKSPSSGLYPAGSGSYKGTMDTAITASGSGSLRFEINGKTSANSAGFWRQAFGKSFGPNSTFFVQFRFRISPEMVNQDWGDPSGNTSWKIAIFHYLPKTCGSVELTTTNVGLDGLPIMYTDCGSRGLFTNAGTPPYLKQQGDTPKSGYNCSFGTNYKRDPRCFRFVPNVWMTFYYQVSIGDWGKPNSKILAWVGVPGEPLRQWVNMWGFVLNYDDPGHNYDSVDLLNYMTGKSTSLDHPTAYAWYDELIVSTQPIAVPQY